MYSSEKQNSEENQFENVFQNVSQLNDTRTHCKLNGLGFASGFPHPNLLTAFFKNTENPEGSYIAL